MPGRSNDPAYTFYQDPNIIEKIWYGDSEWTKQRKIMGELINTFLLLISLLCYCLENVQAELDLFT